MSCNGCRVLRKGCSDSCLLRPCLQWIGSAEAQGHATLFVAKFFGRAGLMSFISAVPPLQRPALFQSLLFEACGRTINPVDGAVGLLGSGNWHLCQAAVEMVLRGGSLCPMPEFAAEAHTADRPDEAGHPSPQRKMGFSSVAKRRKNPAPPDEDEDAACDLDLCLTPRFPSGGGQEKQPWRSGTPSMNSEGSVTTISGESSRADRSIAEPRLLNLFL